MKGGSRVMGLDVTGQRVFYYIRMHPGTYMREMNRELNLAVGVLQYHLHILENEGLVVFERQSFYTFIYESGAFTNTEIRIMNNLAQKPVRDILLFLVQKPGVSQSDIASFIHCTRPTAAWHMKRLVNQGIVESRKEGRSVTYRIAGERSDIVNLIKDYYPSIFNRWASRLADIILSYGNEK